MTTSTIEHVSVLATKVCFDHAMHVELSDGRTVTVPLEWFPRLRRASPAQRENWRLIGNGIGIHWDELDEDVSVEGLLRQ